MKNKNLVVLISGGLSFLMLIAVFNFPYIFYEILRVATFIGSIIIFLILNNLKNFTLLNYVVLLIAIIWNPIIPLFLERTIWLPLNIIASLIYGFIAINIYKSKV